MADLADYCESGGDVPPEHRLFIFKGLLLHPVTLPEPPPRHSSVAQQPSLDRRVLHQTARFSWIREFFLPSFSQAAKIGACGIRDNAVVHLTVNDDPYVGKPLHIKNSNGEVSRQAPKPLLMGLGI